MGESMDRFLPAFDVRERHETLVRAPSSLAFETAERFKLESIALVRAIFWLRSKFMGAHYQPLQKGLIEEMLGLGWSKLAYTPGRELVMGSATQPWIADVKFRTIPADEFAEFSEPGFVKIAWTIEAEPLGPALTRLATETRVLASDEDARAKFRPYWRKFRLGIILIRRLALAAIRKEAERRHRA